MVEEFGRLISNGFETYTKNISLAVPFVINLVITLVFSFFIFLFGFLYILGSSLSALSSAATPEKFISVILPIISSHLFEIGVLILVYFLISLFFQSFFTSGAIGMAKQATETGRSELATMLESGKRNVVNFYLAEILAVLLFLAGIVFIVPGALKTNLSSLSFEENAGAFLLLFAGILLWLVYILILSLILAVFEYALVIDNLGPVDGILAGIRFFNQHKSDVFMMWLFIGVIVFVLTIIGEFIRLVPVLNVIWQVVSMLISVLIFAPLTTLWWARLYMTRTGKKIYFNELLAHPNDLKENQ